MSFHGLLFAQIQFPSSNPSTIPIFMFVIPVSVTQVQFPSEKHKLGKLHFPYYPFRLPSLIKLPFTISRRKEPVAQVVFIHKLKLVGATLKA